MCLYGNLRETLKNQEVCQVNQQKTKRFFPFEEGAKVLKKLNPL